MLGQYLHYYVDGRQMDWVLLLNVTQFGFKAQTKSPTGRSLYEIVCSRHSVLPPLVDHRSVGNNPQVLVKRRNYGYNHLLTRNRKEIAKSKKSLLIKQGRVEDKREVYMNS